MNEMVCLTRGEDLTCGGGKEMFFFIKKERKKKKKKEALPLLERRGSEYRNGV